MFMTNLFFIPKSLLCENKKELKAQFSYVYFGESKYRYELKYLEASKDRIFKDM